MTSRCLAEITYLNLYKAAAVGWHIIRSHVFNDGNKRTRMMACTMVLDWGGYRLLCGWLDPEALAVTLSVASGEMNLAGFTDWVSRTAQSV